MEHKGIIPKNLDEMGWISVNAKLSVFGVEKDDFVGSVAWQLDHSWTWVLHNTRFQGTAPSKEAAQEALVQIFIDAKNIPETRKEKHAVKNKKKDRKDDRHSNAE
jgi:hypothetical protein